MNKLGLKHLIPVSRLTHQNKGRLVTFFDPQEKKVPCRPCTGIPVFSSPEPLGSQGELIGWP